MQDFDQLKELLEINYYKYNTLSFIETDPIQIPHSFDKKEDIEISAFLTSIIAWGRRDMIISNAKKMMKLFENEPYNFITHASENDFKSFEKFVHRTFNSTDLTFFVKSLQNIYKNHNGLQSVFEKSYKKTQNIFETIADFRRIFLELEFPQRTVKHIANVEKKAAAKRINLFLMWLVRKDNVGVHFGLWDKIPMSALMLPLDIHTANMSRALGLLTRKQNDRQAVEELTENLRKFDPNDPVKYDFSLFGIDINLEK